MSQPNVPLNSIKNDLKEIKSSNDAIITMATNTENDALLALALQQQQYIQEMKIKIQVSQDEHYGQFLEDQEMEEIEAEEEEYMEEGDEMEEEDEETDEDGESEMESDEEEESENEEESDDETAPAYPQANN